MKKKLKIVLGLFVVLILIKVGRMFGQALTDYEKKGAESQKIGKYAVLAASTIMEKEFYMFQLPMVAQSWRRVGYEPIVMIIVSDLSDFNYLAQKTIDYLNVLNITVLNVYSEPNYEVMTSMISRLLIGIIPDNIIKDSDFVITTDADLYPIKNSYYEMKYENINLWNYDCCGYFMYNKKRYKMYSMCHVGMTKKNWREVMGLNKKAHSLNGTIVMELVKMYYGSGLIKTNYEIIRGDDSWYLDQKILSINVNRFIQAEKGQTTNYVHSGERLDRNLFHESYIIPSFF